MAVCDALDKFAPHITHSEMTAELEEEMDDIAEGRTTSLKVVDTSRDLLADQLASLLPHSEEVKDALADAVAADAYVGPCPKCGKDLQLRASQKTRGMFIGCAGWPDCDVTYPLPKGKVEAVPEPCPTCGMPQVKVTAFRAKPRTICIDPNCATNKEPDVIVGECPVCKEKGKQANLVAQKNPRTLKRFIRCENYEECGVGYPLPQYGALTGHGRGVRALRRADGDRDHRARPVEALPQLRLPRQGAGRGEEGRVGREGRPRRRRPPRRRPPRSPRRRRLPRRSRLPRRFPPTKPSDQFPIDRLVGPDLPRQRSPAAALSRTYASTGRPGNGFGLLLHTFHQFFTSEGGFSDP